MTQLIDLQWENGNSTRDGVNDTETSPASPASPALPAPTYRSPLNAKNLLPTFVYATLALQVLQLLLVLLLGLGVWALARRPAPTLVQLTDGDSVRVRPADSLERDPAAVRKLVGEVSSLMFNWSDQVAVTSDNGDKLTRDPGVAVGDRDKAKVTTPSWEASFALAADFRQPFLEKLAKLIPPAVWSGQTQVVLEVSHLGEPELIEAGKWKVSQVAKLLIFSGRQPTGQAVPFNKTFYLRAIDTPPLPLPEAATPIQRTVHRLRQANLEIYQIEDLKDE